MTYRTDNHWGVTIVREGEASHTWRPFNVGNTVCAEVGCSYDEAEHPGLVAVVVKGTDGRTPEQEAERICALLNGPPYPARCTLEPGVRGCVCQPWPDCYVGAPQVDSCPDHPGPLDDADGHVCRLRPEPRKHCRVTDPVADGDAYPVTDGDAYCTGAGPRACPRHGAVI